MEIRFKKYYYNTSLIFGRNNFGPPQKKCTSKPSIQTINKHKKTDNAWPACINNSKVLPEKQHELCIETNTPCMYVTDEHQIC